MRIKIIAILFNFLYLPFSPVFSQDSPDKQVINQIAAVVGDEIILQSDMDREKQGMGYVKKGDDLQTCKILNRLIKRKLLLTKAYHDSIPLKNRQVEQELNRRIQYFVSQIGSKERLENFYDKSIGEIKSEMRDPVREMLLVEKMKNKIVGDVNVTPEEVKEYFRNIPKDSLPYYNTEVEVAQIVRFPKPTAKERKRAREKLLNLKKRIQQGASFANMAILYSEDEASATKGGDLGMRHKDDYMPEFASAAMRLTKDSLSGIVETKYGFHLIKLIERRGQNIHAKHILIKPDITREAQAKTRRFLDSLKNVLLSEADTLTFKEAAYLYSMDEKTKNNGGMIINQQTGSTHLEVDQLDANLFFIIDTMEVRSISSPVSTVFPGGREGYRIVRLISRTPPHKANLKMDFPRIKKLALVQKKQEILEEWYRSYASDIYLRIINRYQKCKNLKTFYQ